MDLKYIAIDMPDTTIQVPVWLILYLLGVVIIVYKLK